MDNTNKPKTEQDWYEFWENQGLFKANPSSQKSPYSLLMPPPNLTGELHLGHGMQHVILDALARFKRMEGFDVLLQPGVDHAGILFEGTLNKLFSKEDLYKEKLGREEWLKRAWRFKEQVYKSFHDNWKVFGISADWSREVFTLEPKVQKAVLEEFKTFWEQDLLYKGAYIVQWCPKCGTAIEDLEMEYQERTEKLYYVRYVILGSKATPESIPIRSGSTKENFIIIATARPETIYADVAITTYPNHPKFHLSIGKEAINPLTGSKIPILEDKRVEKGFGTGALKITPGHDPLDYQIGKDHNLPILHAVGKDGKMTKLAQDLAGLKIEEARVKAAQRLEELGALEKVEDYTHSVPVCERCKTVVEPLISEEWFVKMKPLAEKALKNINKINFLPKNYQKIISNWLKKIHDWSISRSLWWGHRIPVWYCQNCNPTHQVGKDKGMVISLEKPEQRCPVCQASDWVQDEQVLDTWFSSGLWPITTLFNSSVNPDDKLEVPREMIKYFPWDFELTAPEIKFLWIARMVMLSLWFIDEIPFKNMFFHGTLRDLKGRKMSKSLGNGVDPLELINKWGTDATRMTLYSYAAPGRDPKASKQTMEERAKNYRNFITKLKNIYRFIYELKPVGARPAAPRGESSRPLSGQDNSAPTKENPDDKWILEELNKTTKEVTKNLDSFQLHLATEELYDFIWHKLADVYIEKCKGRREEAQPVLEKVFISSIKLLHPFMPFVTEELWQKLPHEEKSIMVAKWPKLD